MLLPRPVMRLLLGMVLVIGAMNAQAQSCDGADGLFPPLSGNTVIANGDICANNAVTPYRWEITYTNVDDGGDPNNVEFFIDWGDGSLQTVGAGAGDNFVEQTGANAYRAVVTHFFPAGGANVQCEYVPVVFLQVAGTQCPSTAQNPSPVVRWNTDDENTGALELSEDATGNVIYEICAGETATVRFIDRSEFNCVPANFPGFPPNVRTRWFQFIYGGNPANNTITGSGISINTNTGSNPEGGGVVNLPAGSTYTSQVVERLQPINAPTEFTFDITVPADAQVGEEFAITLNNWNDCNRYQSGGIPTGNDPVPFTALIRIIESPDEPVYVPQDYCLNDPNNLTVIPNSGGAITWYSDAALSNVIHNGATMNAQTDPPAAFQVDNTVPGVHTFYATETLGNNCEGPAEPVTFEIFDDPTVSNPGPDQTICTDNTTLAANTPTVGTGLWTVVSGPGIVTDTALPNSTVTNLSSVVPTVLQWNITNGPCTSFDQVTLTTDPNPTPADAGTDQFECNITGAFLNAVDPAVGTGTWSQVAGPAATIVDPSLFNSQVTGLLGGNTYTFRWTVTNGVCLPTFDEVDVTTDLDPPADAGVDFSVCPPATSTFMNASEPPLGTGTWVVISGPGVVTDVNLFNSEITNVTAETVLEWTVINGVCIDTDQVTISLDIATSISNAGTDDNICSDTYTLNGNTPAAGGGTGIWTVESGSGTFIDENDPTTDVSGLALGANVFRWTITNACGSNFTEVTITNDQPTSADAGTDQVICGNNTNLAANTPVVGVGSWTVITGDGAENIATPGSPTSAFSGTRGFTYVLEWSIANGVCPASTDQVTIELQEDPTPAAAGGDQVICGNSTNLAATAVTIGSGSWSIITGDGSGVITDPTSPTSLFSGTAGQTYELEWITTNGICATSSDQVLIQFDQTPTVSNAGTDQVICGNTATLDANVITVGAGSWSEFSGDGLGSFLDDTDPTTDFTGTPGVNYELEWTSTNGVCAASTSLVNISLEETPTVSLAGNDQQVCGNSTTLEGNTPVIGSGQWTEVTGDGLGAFVLNTDPSTIFTGSPGESYVLRWTITNGTCPISVDDVAIDFSESPTVSDAGLDQIVCGNSTTLDGNVAIIGSGLWTITGPADGLGVIVDPNNPTSTFLGTAGQTYELTWTISNGSCPSSSSIVNIQLDQNPTTAEAGNNQILCTSTTTLDANNPAIGTGQWSFVSNPDGNGVIDDINLFNSGFSGSEGVSYVLQWTISNGSCLASSDVVTIEIGAAIPAPSINGPAQNCIGEIVTFTVPGGNPAVYDYTWDVSTLPASTAVVAGSGSPFQFITLEFYDAGTGNLSVTVTDKATGCVGPGTSIPLEIFSSPNMELTSSDPDLIICLGEEVTFTANDLNGIATSYEFILNGNIVQTGASNTYTTSSLLPGNSMIVQGFSAICPGIPSPTVEHIVNPNPTPYNVTGGGELCPGDVGQTVRLSDSEAGVEYELFRDGMTTGETISSIGGQLIFNPQTVAGIYTVRAENFNGCSVDMSGSAEVIVNTLPAVYNFTGGGSLCQGNPGNLMFLNNSDIGVEYTVYRDGLPFTAPLSGTGALLEFGPFNAPGSYEVMAENISGCNQLMNGNPQVTIDPLPTVTEVNNRPTLCNNENTEIILQSNLGNSAFTWVAEFDAAVITGASNSTIPAPENAVISQNLRNSGNAPSQVRYRIIPNNGCEGNEKVVNVTVNPSPDASIAGDTEICKDDDTFVVFTSNGIPPFDISYTANGVSETVFGVGAVYNMVVNPDVTTTYILTEIVDANGCSFNPVAQSARVDVVEIIANFTGPNPAEDCSPYTVTFENVNIQAGVEYEWNWGDGTGNEMNNDVSVAHVFENNSTTLSRTYTVSLTATYDNGGAVCVDVMEMDVEVFPNVVPDVEPDITEDCSPMTVNFRNRTQGVFNHTWFYRVQGTNDQLGLTNAEAPQFTLDNTTGSPLIYEVVYQAANVNCDATQIVELTVFPDVEALFNVNGNQAPAAVVLTDPVHADIDPLIPNRPGWTYEWEYGDGQTFTGYQPTPAYRYQNAGDYRISLTVTEPDGNCFAEFFVDLRVEPVIPIVEFSATPLSGCRPLEVQFTNQSFGVAPDTYEWEFIKSTGRVVGTSTEANPVFTFFEPGVYSVRLSGRNELGTGDSEFKENYIEVYDLPVASFLFRPDRVFLPGGTVFTENRSFGATDFRWDFGDGTTYDIFEPEHKYETSGTYSIELIALNSKGCSDTLMLESAVEVIEGGTLRVPNAFTPSLNGPTGGVAGAGTFNDVFLPIVEGATEFNMLIFDRWGNLIFESNDVTVGWDGYNDQGQLLPSGIYVYKLKMKFSNGELFEKIGDITLIR